MMPPMQQDVRFCTTTDGVRIAYATVGQGPPLVKAANWLNHLEFDWQSPIWRHFFEALASHHLLVRYDERGNGLSDWTVENFAFEAFVRDLEAVVDAAGLDRFALFGISQGASVAIAYAVRYPERVTHLIIYGGFAQGWATRANESEIATRRGMLALIEAGWGQDNPAFRQLFTSLYAPDATPEQAASYNELQRLTTSPANAARLFLAFADIEVTDLLPQVTTPTLVLHCRDESVVPFESGREIAAGILNAKFVALDGRNHLLLDHEPSWPVFLDEVGRFLGTPLRRARAADTPASETATGPVFREGASVGRYQIESRLGAGGMGVVYRATDGRLKRTVAIKVLPQSLTSDEEAKARFVREAQAASALDHPNICTIHDIDETPDGQLYLAMAHYSGGTVKDRIDGGHLEVNVALDMAIQVAQGLAKAHDAGITHRDIKPANVMLTADGGVKIVDFGLAKLAGQAGLTDTGITLGTVAYMSPEQLDSQPVDGRTDLWALGVMLYEMLAGRRPFEGDNPLAIAMAIQQKGPPPLTSIRSGIERDVERLVTRLLEKDVEGRYQTAVDLLAELRRVKRDSESANGRH